MNKGDSDFNWIAKLPARVAEQVTAHLSYRQLQAGQVAYRYAEEADATYQIINGSIQTSNVTSEGKEILIHIMMPGDCFGEIGLIEGSLRAQTAYAREDTELAVLNKKDFNQLRAQHPEINDELLKMQCRRLRMTMVFMEDSALRSLSQKLARRLIMMATMTGVQRDNHILIKLVLSQEELGQMLGASRQSINKELNQLERQNIIRKSKEGICILDPQALNQIS